MAVWSFCDVTAVVVRPEPRVRQSRLRLQVLLVYVRVQGWSSRQQTCKDLPPNNNFTTHKHRSTCTHTVTRVNTCLSNTELNYMWHIYTYIHSPYRFRLRYSSYDDCYYLHWDSAVCPPLARITGLTNGVHSFSGITRYVDDSTGQVRNLIILYAHVTSCTYGHWISVVA